MSIRSLRGDRRGMAALEYGIIAPIFLLLLLGIVQVCLLVFTQNVLDVTTRTAARLIQTGQVQSAGGSSSIFQSSLCSSFTSPLLNCANLVWTVQSGANFAAASANLPNTAPAQSSFAPGGPGDAVVVQVFYNQALLIPLLAPFFSVNGTTLLTATLAFRNESYNGSGT